MLADSASLLTVTELDGAAKARIPLVPWVVNEEARLRLLLGHDAVAGVITDEVTRALAIKRRL